MTLPLDEFWPAVERECHRGAGPRFSLVSLMVLLVAVLGQPVGSIQRAGPWASIMGAGKAPAAADELSNLKGRLLFQASSRVPVSLRTLPCHVRANISDCSPRCFGQEHAGVGMTASFPVSLHTG
jgi:hypothetical protein